MNPQKHIQKTNAKKDQLKGCGNRSLIQIQADRTQHTRSISPDSFAPTAGCGHFIVRTIGFLDLILLILGIVPTRWSMLPIGIKGTSET